LLVPTPKEGISTDKTAPAPKNLRSGHKRSQEHATGSEGAKPKHPPLFPKASQAPARNGGETDREARQGKRRRDQRPGSRSRTRPGHEPSSSPEAAAPARQGPWVGTGRLTTRSHEKQSHVVVAATRPRSLLEKWTKSTEERGRRGRHEAGAQVPGGRFGGQDQKGSLTRRSFLCSDSALPPAVPARRAPPPRCRSIGALGELPLQSII